MQFSVTVQVESGQMPPGRPRPYASFAYDKTSPSIRSLEMKLRSLPTLLFQLEVPRTDGSDTHMWLMPGILVMSGRCFQHRSQQPGEAASLVCHALRCCHQQRECGASILQLRLRPRWLRGAAWTEPRQSLHVPAVLEVASA